MLKIGIDDAGRGPVIGPMVLAGCLVDEEIEKYFKQIGVKDSKELTQARREFLKQKILEKVKSHEIVVIEPNEIDSKNGDGVKLNEVEALAAAEIINKLNKTEEKIKIIIDCPSTTISKWCDFLKTKLKILSNLEISCEHKADQNHVSVSAASILAKCARKIYGEEIGTGYPSDPLTCRFLEQNALNHKNSGIFRKTWSTWKRACGNLKQKKLF
jgi:ribonuclease HII